MAAAAGLSGWLSITDRLWGVEWVQELHEALANALFAMAGLHVAGVAFTSWRQRENLVLAMLTGRKPAPRPGDVD
jgi:cytochrome b